MYQTIYGGSLFLHTFFPIILKEEMFITRLYNADIIRMALSNGAHIVSSRLRKGFFSYLTMQILLSLKSSAQMELQVSPNL